MAKYIIKRLFQAIPLVIIVSIIVFSLIKLAPYDAIDAMTTPDMEPEVVEMIKKQYGYDKPAYEQYFSWIKNTAVGNFGYSIHNHYSISSELSLRIPSTMKLMIPSYFTAFFLAILIGSLAGYYHGGFFDKLTDFLCSLSIATPNFWVALLLIYFFGMKLDLLPTYAMHTIGQEDSFVDFLKHFILPYSVLTFTFLPRLIRYVRSSTVSQINQDYVLVQRAYGANNAEILFRHIQKNALLPVITQLGLMLPYLVTGSIIVESVFSWPGVGPYFVRAIAGKDFPVVMTIVLLSSFLVIVGNLISDILYCVVDPRIREMG